MSFLWPYAWLFSLLAIPIVLLYLIRTLPRRRPVSTLLFWSQIQPQLRSSPLWRKLRRLFSLLLQLLFLFLLIFLLARPLLPWQDHEPQAVVLVVDTSASMAAGGDGRTSLEKARGFLEDRILHLRADDEAMIIAAGGSPRVLQRWSPNRQLLLEAAEKLIPDPVESDLGAALDLAASLARQRDNGRVVLLTDGVIAEPVGDRPQVPVEVVAIDPPELPNRGLVEFSARRSRLDPESILIRAHLVRSGSEVRNGDVGKLELTVNGQLTDVLPLSFVEDEAVEKIWRIPETGSARIEARILSDSPDSLPPDDSASLEIDPVERLAVRLVAPPNPFLEAILSSLDRVDAARIAPEALPATPDEALYLFHKATPPKEFAPSAMMLIRPKGSGVWGETLPGESAESLVTEWEEESDLLRHVDLDQVVFPKFARFALPSSAEVYASSFEDPVLFGEWDAEPRWLATAFGLEESDLVYRTVFPILIGNIVRSLSLSASMDSAALPGEIESRLLAFPERLAPGAENEGTDSEASPEFSLSLPLRSWLLMAALGWALLEWRLFHRRITE